MFVIMEEWPKTCCEADCVRGSCNKGKCVCTYGNLMGTVLQVPAKAGKCDQNGEMLNANVSMEKVYFPNCKKKN